MQLGPFFFGNDGDFLMFYSDKWIFIDIFKLNKIFLNCINHPFIGTYDWFANQMKTNANLLLIS